MDEQMNEDNACAQALCVFMLAYIIYKFILSVTSL